MNRILGLACGLVLGAAGVAGAQVVGETQTTTTGAPVAQATGPTWRLSQLLGSTVQLQGSNNFGRVEDAVIDQNGGISYLVVSSNGQNVMLPWSEANFNYGQRVVTYAVTPQAVRPLYFQANAWPNVWAPQYVTQVRRVFPRVGFFRREVLRPAIPVAPGTVVTPPGTVVAPPGTVVTPPGTVVIPPATTVPPGGVVRPREVIR
jgi:hypothetical protein